MLDVVFGQASDAGRVRPHNEDAVAYFVPRSRQESQFRGWLFAVADGAGGRNLGEVASARAVRAIAEGFAQSLENAPPAVVLPALIQAANASVRHEGLSPERRGHPMTSTIVTCVLRHDQAVISHVGDSRCYLVRDGKATQLTPDHTWVNEQRTLGLITATAAEQSEKRRVLTRCLGRELTVAVDTTTIALKPGDTL
ncbi:MAG TPA: protein phosphatase 2C domain-containing protein, partial [Acidobacteriaceae bacterium]